MKTKSNKSVIKQQNQTKSKQNGNDAQNQTVKIQTKVSGESQSNNESTYTKLNKNNSKCCLNQESYEKTKLLSCSLIVDSFQFFPLLYVPNMQKYLTNGLKRISKVSVYVQRVYLSKTVIQETKSTCNMKYVWYIKKLENTASAIGIIFVNFHSPFTCLAYKIDFGIW